MKIYLKKINTSLIGFILVLHLFISLLITNVGFVFGFPVQFFYYPLSLLLCLIIYKNNLPKEFEFEGRIFGRKYFDGCFKPYLVEYFKI